MFPRGPAITHNTFNLPVLSADDAYETDKVIRAYSRRTGTWYWSVFSTPVPGQKAEAFRVDTQNGDELEDFECYVVCENPDHSFVPTFWVEGVYAVYS
jgi:hypothetical protein